MVGTEHDDGSSRSETAVDLTQAGGVPDLVTVIVVDVDLDIDHEGDGERSDVVAGVRDVVLRAGGTDIRSEEPDGERHVVAAVFRSVADAVRAAVELAIGRAAAGPDDDASPTLRAALCTGSTAGQGGRPDRTPEVRAEALLQHATPTQVLTTASTAVLGARGLPRGVELVDGGNVRLGQGWPPERVYQLRFEDDQAPEDRIGASNLEWARRAVDGPVLGFGEPLAAALKAWKAVLDGRPGLVLLTGDAGPAATMVAAEVALRLHSEGAQVLYGRWDRHATAPYEAVREALGVHADGCSFEALRAHLDGWGDEIGRLLPDVGARVGGQPPRPTTPRAAPGGMFRAVEAWLGALARRRPTLLVLDDLHNADAESFSLLDALRHPQGVDPLLVLVTAAVDETSGDGTAGRVAAFTAQADSSEFDHIPLHPG